jgi:hypothetical protein
LVILFLIAIISCEKENDQIAKGTLEIEFQEKISQLKSAGLISSYDSYQMGK